MGIRISGPGVGPVHTTLYSSRGGNSGCGSIIGGTIALIFLGIIVWDYPWVGIVLGALVALAVYGAVIQHRAKTQATARDHRPEPQAKHSDRR